MTAQAVPFEVGMASLPAHGAPVSGDACAVVPHARGALVAGIDGLGHGAEAATAAQLAVEVLRLHAELPVLELLSLCHEKLRGTRGAVMSLASIDVDAHAITWTGVGNVEGVLVRGASSASPARESLLVRGGVVGYQLPPSRASTLPIHAGDVLVFATDGVQNLFPRAVDALKPVQELAEDILRTFGKSNDDALVLAVRVCI